MMRPSISGPFLARTRRPTLPNLLIIGAMKAGTTSLHHYLSLHPQIFMSRRKELDFFDKDMRWHLGFDWYKSNFDAAFPINGESSPQYTRYPRSLGVPARIKEVLGAPKLIYIVRDPIDRLTSHYAEVIDQWRETRPFSEIVRNIQSEKAQYIQCSSYFLQLSQYLKVIPRESIKLVILERLRNNPKDTLRQVFRFLGVDENFWSSDFNYHLNSGAQKSPPAEWFVNIAPPALKREWIKARVIPWRLALTIRWVSRIGSRPVGKISPSPEVDHALQRILASDVACLRDFLSDPLPEWRPYN